MSDITHLTAEESEALAADIRAEVDAVLLAFSARHGKMGPDACASCVGRAVMVALLEAAATQAAIAGMGPTDAGHAMALFAIAVMRARKAIGVVGAPREHVH